MNGDPVTAQNQQNKEQNDPHSTNEAQLLADDSEDVIVVLLGQIQVLLAAATQSQTQEAPGADGVAGLNDLIAGVERVAFRVEPGCDAGTGVAPGCKVDAEENQSRRAAQKEPAFFRAANEHHDGPDDENNHRGGKMLFQDQQSRN